MKEVYEPLVWDADDDIEIPYEIRDQHIFIPGKTRHGKSNQLLQMIMQDIENGCGVGVLDPAGDLIKAICNQLPPNRVDDCIYLDLDDPIPLDVMGHSSKAEHLVGDIKALVLKGDTTLKRAEPILTRLIYSLLKVPGTRFTDIEEFFTDPDRKKVILDSLEIIDPKRWKHWKNNPPSRDYYAPLTARMTDFTQNDSLAIILGESFPRLNISKAMDERKIILADLSGTGEPREIYGSLLVTRIQQAAFARSKIHVSKRIPFFLFVDEFENFQTSSFAKIFSEAGKFGLRLTLGNQYIKQLSDAIRAAIIGNAGSYIIFHMEEDLSLFEHVVYPFDYKRIGRLPKYQAIYKIGDRGPIFKWSKEAPSVAEEDEPYVDRVIALLKANTLRDYGPRAATSAESGQNRSGDKSSSNSPQERHTEVNGNTDAQSDEVENFAAPTPADYREGPNLGDAQRILRAQDKGHRGAKPKPNPKRQ